MKDYSYIFNAHSSYIEQMYKSYKNDNTSVDEGWRTFFAGFEFNDPNISDAGVALSSDNDLQKEFCVLDLIYGYRQRAHLLAETNPVRNRLDRKAELDLADYGLSDADLDTKFAAGFTAGLNNATLREIIEKLSGIYTSDIGFEFMHIEDNDRRNWLQEKIERRSVQADYALPQNKKDRILEKINEAVTFESFLGTKYLAQKRFSLEGGESAIPALDRCIQDAADKGVKHVVIGMAHRGRLNVLANIMGKPYEQILSEFEGIEPDGLEGSGDVKYHLGYSSSMTTEQGNEVKLELMPNPSHLEAVNPVAEGYARAKADLNYNSEYRQVLPILIHGDAAVVGQGIVYETAQMSQLEAYHTGGTVHLVINNQVGFTTDFTDARSSIYSTAAALMTEAPVFHVNGDNPEAVVFAIELAIAYRMEFGSDVYLDMVCYRKHGHNEGDDPSFTQPLLYKAIKQHNDPLVTYVEKLISRGELSQDKADALRQKFWDMLQVQLDDVKSTGKSFKYQGPEAEWENMKLTTDPKDFEKSPATGITAKIADQILGHLQTLPEGFAPLSKVKRLLKGANKFIEADNVDWALAELLAYGSIMLEGENVRMTGQDVRRGTFSHRHAVFYDVNTKEAYNRLSGMADNQGEFRIYNSFLSEFAVLGYEYGYSLASPEGLTIWEAQFGDFYNGAQSMVDQFITSAETKWQKCSGLVMLLPHGFEGQGPEHSSGRVERFLQSCADYNVTVANVSTPANFFHLLRRQNARPFRKPLIVMTPKSGLRHPLMVSKKSDLVGKTGFQEIIGDATVDAKKTRRVLLCTGKMAFDLMQYRTENNIDDVAIVRVEQLYPLPENQIREELKQYGDAEIFWVQEEPSNMGYWDYLMRYFRRDPIELISREASSSPATGFKSVHLEEQDAILKEAFGK